MLILHGADVSAKDSLGRTPLFNIIERITYLDTLGRVQSGSSLSKEDLSSWPNLNSNYKDTVKTFHWLIARGAALQEKDNNGKTVLAVAKEEAQRSYHNEYLNRFIKILETMTDTEQEEDNK